MATITDVQNEIQEVKEEIGEVKKEIKKVEEKIDHVEEEIKKATDIEEKNKLRDEKNKLLDKEKQLRDKENKLLDKENKLLDKEKQLRDEKNKLLEHSAGGSQVRLFQVLASIPGAKKAKYVRGRVYKGAEEKLAFRRDDSGNKYIWYEGDDLKVDLYFESKENAMKFQTLLRHWNFNNPLFKINEPLLEPLREEAGSFPLMPVLLKDYDGAASDSPCQTLSELQGCVISLATEIEPDTDLGKYQSLEQPAWLQIGGSNPYKIHLKNRGKSYGHDAGLASNENNLLTGSWTFHQFVDGLNMLDRLPIVALRPGEMQEEVELGPGHKRRKVVVDVVCRDENTFHSVAQMLREGSIHKEGLVMSSHVLVEDANLFVECLQWKYEDTKKKWDAADAQLLAE